MFALLVSLALVVATTLIFRISYDTNDDVFLSMIAAGQGFCPAPDEHLVFTNVIIGHALKWLYTVAPDVPWYGCYLLAIHVLAQAAVLYVALASDRAVGVAESRAPEAVPRSASRLALYLVYFAVVELVLLNHLQFTTTAFVAAQGGLFLVGHAARRHSSSPAASVFAPLTAAVALVVLAGLVRLESLFMALLVAAPLAVLARQTLRRALVPVGAAAGVAAALLTLATLTNRAAYDSDPRWHDFFAYNPLRCKFNDYQWTSYNSDTAPIFAAVGWSKNDHDMIAHWFFDEPNLYSQAKLRQVLDAYPWKTAHLTGAYIGEVCRRLLQDRSVWCVLLALPFVLGVLAESVRARRAVLSCAFMGLCLVVLLVLNNKRPPMRTYFPLLSFPLAVTLLFPARRAGPATLPAKAAELPGRLQRAQAAWRAQSPWTRTAIVMLVVGLVMGLHREGRRSVRVVRNRAALHAYLDELRAGPRKLCVCWEAAMPFELMSPLGNLDSWSGVSLVNLTWTQRTPWQEDIKRAFGITDLARAMCDSDDIVLVANETHRQLFARFAQEHFSADVEFVASRQVGEQGLAGHYQRRSGHNDTVRKPDPVISR
ncbi:MAG: hypothetical protein AB7O59_20055 [Pirellulales bacterium]